MFSEQTDSKSRGVIIKHINRSDVELRKFSEVRDKNQVNALLRMFSEQSESKSRGANY